MLVTAETNQHMTAPKQATSAREAVRLIKSGDRVYLHAGCAVPGALLGASGPQVGTS